MWLQRSERLGNPLGDPLMEEDKSGAGRWPGPR